MNGLYEWMNQFHVSRLKKNIARDFSDAVLLAEILAQLYPTWVDLHNYPATNRFQQKILNWETLNRKILTRIKCEISSKHQHDLANAVPGAIELVLLQVKKQTAKAPGYKAVLKRAPLSDNRENICASPPKGTNRQLHRPRPTTDPPISPVGSPSLPQTLSSAVSDSKPPSLAWSNDESIVSSFSSILKLVMQSERRTKCFDEMTMCKASKARASTPRSHNKNPKPINRPASADAKSRWVCPQDPQTVSQTDSSIHGSSSTASNSHTGPTCQGAFMRHQSAGFRHLSQTEFAKDSFVYFLCSDQLPGSEKCTENSYVQVGRVIKPMSSGEFLIQLFKPAPSDFSDKYMKDDGDHKRSYVSTPYFIECCGSQLHNIQNIAFNATTRTWVWNPESNMHSHDCAGNRSTRAGDLSTKQSSAKWNRMIVDKQSERPRSQSMYFFTEVLSKVKCSTVSATQPITIEAKDSDSAFKCVPCAEFISSVPSTAIFQATNTPILYPAVHLEIPPHVMSPYGSKALKQAFC